MGGMKKEKGMTQKKKKCTYALVNEITGQVFEGFECQLRGISRDEIAYQSNLKHESHLTVAILHD